MECIQVHDQNFVLISACSSPSEVPFPAWKDQRLSSGIQFEALIFEVSMSSCTLLTTAPLLNIYYICTDAFLSSQLLPESLSVVCGYFTALEGVRSNDMLAQEGLELWMHSLPIQFSFPCSLDCLSSVLQINHKIHVFQLNFTSLQLMDCKRWSKQEKKGLI